MEEKWLVWAKKLQAIAQSGLAYTDNPYEIERYQALRNLSVEIMEEYTDLEFNKISKIFCGETGYQTPKIDVRGAVVENDKILLVHESIDNKWSIPGGWADIDLSLKENIKKELKEEAGLCVEPQKLVGIFDWIRNTEVPSPFAIYKIVMLCDCISGGFESNIETKDADFFDLDHLPELSKGRTTKKLIEACIYASRTYTREPIIE